jgi:hypothetical protein
MAKLPLVRAVARLMGRLANKPPFRRDCADSRKWFLLLADCFVAPANCFAGETIAKQTALPAKRC